MTKNTSSTRYFSSEQERSVAKKLNGSATSSSGSGHFRKGDVVCKDSSLLVECKCVMSPKKSISIKKEWIDKNKEEAFETRLFNQAICINFDPGGENYFLINERLMSFLTEKLEEENQN